MRLLPAFVLLLALGCVAPEPGRVSPPDVAPTLAPVVGEPVAQEHDHADRALHNGSLNLDLVAFVKPWGDGSSFGQGTVNEFAIHGDLVFVSRSNPEGGFAVVDLSNVSSPKVVGDFRSEGGGDVEVTADGKYALLATQRTLPGQQTLDNPLAREPRGVYLVDVSTPSRPTLASFLPLPTNGPHTIFYHKAPDGREIVALQTYDLITDPATGALLGAAPVTQRVYLALLVRDGAGARLDVKGAYQVTDLPPQGKLYFPHDAFIETHPLTGKLLLYVAYWDAGLHVVDVGDMAQPRLVAAYHDFGPSALAQLHDARTFPALLDGRHVTAVGPEIVTAPEAGQITFIDTTDPARPEKLGWWSVPGNLTVDQPFVFSPHVFDVDATGRVVIGHNHAGVWLIDARDPANATALGYYFPHEERPGYQGPQPSVWGARFFRGLVLATDGPTGLYVLQPAEGAVPGSPVGRVG